LSNIELDTSSSVGSQTPIKKPKKILKRHTLMEHTRYYYNTFDSNENDINDFGYLYKREFDEKTSEFTFVQNMKKEGEEKK